MKVEIDKFKKLDDVKNDDFTKVQSYFNEKSIETGRLSFNMRCSMLQEIPGNVKKMVKRSQRAVLSNL